MFKNISYLFKALWSKCVKHLGNNSDRIRYTRSIGVSVGDHCFIAKSVDFGSEPYLIKVGNYVRLTEGVRLITHDGGLWVLRNNHMLDNSDKFGTIEIKDNVHIGINTIIMPGVVIGENCIIGCGAVVTKNIPPNSIAAGVPARVIKSLQEYYEKNASLCDYTKNMSPNEKKLYLLKKYGFTNQ